MGKRAAEAVAADEYEDNALVRQLKVLDEQYETLKYQFSVESDNLREKYSQRYREVLARRAQRLAVDDGGAAGAGAGGASASSSSHAESFRKATPAVPGFWKTVLQNSAEFQEDIEEYDEPVLDYLREIESEPLKGDSRGQRDGFRLVLRFSPNPFFSDTELVKVYHTERKGAFSEEFGCVRVEAPKISWRPGKNVTVEIVTRKHKETGRSKASKAKREEVSRPSFFRTFFRNLGPDEEIPEEELDEQFDESEEDTQDIMECLLNDDYEQGLALREHIAPRAVRWYTGDACDEDDDDEDEDEEEEEEENDDDMDVEESGAEEDGGAGAGGAAEGGAASEAKRQGRKNSGGSAGREAGGGGGGGDQSAGQECSPQ